MKAFQHFRQIHHRTYIGTVGAAARQPGGAELADEIGTAAEVRAATMDWLWPSSNTN